MLFPGTVHCEPHEHISWAQFQYIIDEYGGLTSSVLYHSLQYLLLQLWLLFVCNCCIFSSDMFFEISDDENILQDRGASNPVVSTGFLITFSHLI